MQETWGPVKIISGADGTKVSDLAVTIQPESLATRGKAEISRNLSRQTGAWVVD